MLLPKACCVFGFDRNQRLQRSREQLLAGTEVRVLQSMNADFDDQMQQVHLVEFEGRRVWVLEVEAQLQHPVEAL